MISRDHHDVSGTDAPFRETSNIEDGSMFCSGHMMLMAFFLPEKVFFFSDMAVHNFVGDSFRGATWVALHNGGGTGWGVAVNGGFGLVLDGTKDVKEEKLMCANYFFCSLMWSLCSRPNVELNKCCFGM